MEITQSQVLSIIVTDLGFYSDDLKSINIQGDHDLKISFCIKQYIYVCTLTVHFNKPGKFRGHIYTLKTMIARLETQVPCSSTIAS